MMARSPAKSWISNSRTRKAILPAPSPVLSLVKPLPGAEPFWEAAEREAAEAAEAVVSEEARAVVLPFLLQLAVGAEVAPAAGGW